MTGQKAAKKFLLSHSLFLSSHIFPVVIKCFGFSLLIMCSQQKLAAFIPVNLYTEGDLWLTAMSCPERDMWLISMS